MGNRLPNWLQPGIRDVVPERFETVRSRLGGQTATRLLSERQLIARARAGGLATAKALGKEGRRALAAKAWAARSLLEWQAHYPRCTRRPPMSYRTFLVLQFYAQQAGPTYGQVVLRALGGEMCMTNLYDVQRELRAQGLLTRCYTLKGAPRPYQITPAGLDAYRAVLEVANNE